MKLPAARTITSADQARQLAIDWQSWQSTVSLSMGMMAAWQSLFTELANKFDLVDEFTENGII